MILIVDDIPDSCEIMSRHLRREGYQVKGANSAREAWSFLQSGGDVPQLIILDVMMPEQGGRALLGQVREDPRLRDVPVLVCSADSSYACVSEMLDRGAQGYLVKGTFDRECLIHCVERFGGPPRDARAAVPAASGQAPVHETLPS